MPEHYAPPAQRGYGSRIKTHLIPDRADLLNIVLGGCVGWAIGHGLDDGWAADHVSVLVMLVAACVLAWGVEPRR